MNSKKFELLFDYLKKTDSKILMPQIIYEEVTEKYSKAVNSKINEFEGLKKSFGCLLINKCVPDLDLSINSLIKIYQEFIKQKLKFTDEEIIPYKENYLKEIVFRAIKRIKPISEKGEEFRDAILWLTLIDIAKVSKEKIIILISNDNRAFGHNHRLHDQLSEEAKCYGIEIKYFNSINKFIETHASQIDYITKEWLTKNIKFEEIEEQTTPRMEKFIENLKDFELRERGWANYEFTGFVNMASGYVGEQNLSDYYVYEKLDGSLFVEAIYYIEVEIEFVYKEKIRKGSLYFSLFKNEPKEVNELFDYNYEYKTKYKNEYPEAEVILGIKIVGKKIEEIELLSLSI